MIEDNNFQISIESDDSDFAFAESKALRKYLMNEEFDEELEVKQKRKKLNDDEAGGLLEASLQILCATPAIIHLAKCLTTWFKTRGQKAANQKKPMKITIQTAEGATITLEAEDFENLETKGEKELLGNITRILKLGNDFLA